jgi:hypothetical protein
MTSNPVAHTDFKFQFLHNNDSIWTHWCWWGGLITYLNIPNDTHCLKSKVNPVTCHAATEGSTGTSSIPWEWPTMHCTGGSVDPTDGLDTCWKHCTHKDSNPGPSRLYWTATLTAPSQSLHWPHHLNHYTDRTISITTLTTPPQSLHWPHHLNRYTDRTTSIATLTAPPKSLHWPHHLNRYTDCTISIATMTAKSQPNMNKILKIFSWSCKFKMFCYTDSNCVLLNLHFGKIWGIHNHAVEDLILPGCDATLLCL